MGAVVWSADRPVSRARVNLDAAAALIHHFATLPLNRKATR